MSSGYTNCHPLFLFLSFSVCVSLILSVYISCTLSLYVYHSLYLTADLYPKTNTHWLCWPFQLDNFVDDICTQCGISFWYVAQFCIPCGHFSASHSNGLPARLHCCGFCHLQIHSSTDLPSLNEKHMQCTETELHNLCHMLHRSWTLTLCITNQQISQPCDKWIVILEDQ